MKLMGPEPRVAFYKIIKNPDMLISGFKFGLRAKEDKSLRSFLMRYSRN